VDHPRLADFLLVAGQLGPLPRQEDLRREVRRREVRLPKVGARPAVDRQERPAESRPPVPRHRHRGA
jgi:hypothetical protein